MSIGRGVKGKKGVKQTGVKHGLDVLCQQNNLQVLSQNDSYFNSSNRAIHISYNGTYFASYNTYYLHAS